MSEESIKLPVTTQTILDRSPKRQIMKAMNGITREIVLHNDAMPPISSLCRRFDEQQVEEVVAMFIQDASMFVGEKMLREDALDCAAEIMNTYPYRSLKLEEIYIICQEIKQSDNYGKLTPNKMFAAVKKFWKDREKRAIRHSVDQSQLHKGDNDLDERIHKSVRMPDQVNNIISRHRTHHQKYIK